MQARSSVAELVIDSKNAKLPARDENRGSVFVRCVPSGNVIVAVVPSTVAAIRTAPVLGASADAHPYLARVLAQEGRYRDGFPV